MDDADIVPVLLVGFGDSPLARELVPRLKIAGHAVVAVRDVRSLSTLLSRMPTATVVVYDHGEFGAAERVLSSVQDAHRRAAVVFVVEHAEFSQYYALMNQGVIGYFEANEPTALILAGVTHAARLAHAS